MELIALVTGGNRGIGKEICFQLAKNRVRVILTARNQNKGERAVKELKEGGVNPEFMELDVSSYDSIKSLATKCNEQIDHLDILVNNAGIMPGPNTTQKVPRETLQQAMNVNFMGPLSLSQELMPLLKKSDHGKIINISSGMGALHEAGPGYAAYRISKAALNALTVFMSEDLRSSGVSIYSVCPGWVKTDMGGKNAPLPISEGADTAVWLAVNHEGESGKFYRKRKVIPW